jgi:hypothetical protein
MGNNNKEKKSMEVKLKCIASISGLGLLALVSGQASAYICTGTGNDFADPLCDGDEITAALGMPFDATLLAKDDAPNNPGHGTGGSDLFGTLEVTQIASTIDGQVRFTYTGVTPQVIVEKADGWYSVYDWLTQISAGDGYYYFNREFGDFDCSARGINCIAATSHLSAYGDGSAVPIPAAAWLFGSGMLGLVGIARRGKTQATTT